MSRKSHLLTVVQRALIFVILICIAVMLEFFISNYRNLFIDTKDYAVNTELINGDAVSLEKDRNAQYWAENVPDKLFAIRIRTSSPQIDAFTKPIKVVIKGYDARRSDTYATLITTILVPGEDRVIAMDCELSRPTLDFTFSDVTAAGSVISVTANPTATIRTFDYSRCLVILLIELILWLGAIFKLGKTPFDFRRTSHVVAVAATFCVCILLTGVFCGVLVGKGEAIPYPLEKGINTYNPYIQQTDAFLKGQLHIDYPVPEKLLELENPYDYGERKNTPGLYYLWDRAMYDGKYYSYFGVAPIVNLYLPHYWLTDTLPSDETVVTLYTMMTVIFSTLFVVAYVVLFRKKVPVYLLCLGLLSLVFSSGVLLMARGVQRFYYIAILAGMAYFAAFLFFLLLAVKSRHPVWRPMLYLLAGLSYAMLFLSRLNMALLAAFIVLPVVLFAVILRRPAMVCGEDESTLLPPENKESLEEAGERASVLQKLRKAVFSKRVFRVAADLVALAFFVVLALVFTLWYNNARFGSPLQFGTSYQLTVSDVSQNKLSLDGIPPAIYHYFLQPLNLSAEFPFVSLRYSNLFNYGCYVYVDTGVGLFSIPLMLGCLLAIPTVCNKKKTVFARSLSALFLLGLLTVAVMNFCLGGVIFRYTCDMTLLAAIASLLLLFSFHEDHASAEGSGTVCRVAVAGILLASLFVCSQLSVSINGNLASYDMAFFARLAAFFGL
ncbi:MAG: hypothetical protein IJD10_01560 [Clostridia bacterium]|nr:hypothetical protein [Clostridia bacterium]